MTIFRGELGGWFLVMLVSLLVGKIWGWIGEGRVEYLEQQPPSNPRLFHTRLAISLVLSVLFNSSMLEYCVKTVLEQARADMMVMFGFEFAVLTILSCSTAVRYAIALVEIYITRQQMKAKVEERRAEIRAARAEALRVHVESGGSGLPANLPDENDINEMELDVPGWEEKGRYVFYLDLLTDFLKLAVYLAFFAILFTFYGLPIHILRDVVVTIRSFGRRIMDFLRYRNATRDMNERYPDATTQDVGSDDVCIICREQMTPWDQTAGADGAAPARPRVPDRLRPKKLPCGHILHFSCLRSWLERQQNCPTCRRPVVMPPRNRVLPGQGVNDARGMGGAAAQPNVPAGNQPAGPNGVAPDGLPRARVYQFGPFRIGFGAGRADMFQNLQQQIHQGNAPVQQPGNVNLPGAQHIGFGIGFGRPPPAVPAASAAQPTSVASVPNVSNIQNQLQQMEQQIMQEINSLRVASEQLQLVGLLQGELQRLRTLQANLQANSSTPNSAPGISLHDLPASSSSTSSITVRRQFISDPRTPALGAGDSRLPEGLTLPQGWTLLPLHSTEVGAGGTPQSNPVSAAPEASVASAPPAHPSSPSPNTAENTHWDHDRDGNGNLNFPQTRYPVERRTQASGSQAEPPSPEWMDLMHSDPPEKSSEAPPASVAENDEHPESERPESDHPQRDSSNEGDSSTSPAKGKGRAVTVEEVVDDET